MSFAAELLVSAVLVFGSFFLLVGSFGLAKLPDMMRRLHGPTKATTLGIGSLLVASMAHAWFAFGVLSWHELLIAIFLFIAAPITGYMIAKAHILHDAETERSLPPSGLGTPWATLHPGAEERPADLRPAEDRAPERG